MAFGDFTVVRASEKRVLGSSGTLVTYANNFPAFEYNADGTYRGLLVEPGATNLFLQSQTISVSPWALVLSGAGVAPVVTATAGVAPDGTTTATRIQLNSGGGTINDRSIWRQPVTIVNATVYTCSIWVRATSLGVVGNTVRIAFEGTSPIASTTHTLTLGWQRVSVTGTSNTTLGSIIIECRGTVTGQTADLLAWGAQLETGSVATSYIPTVASTANRVADSVTLTGASSLIGQSAGSIFCEFEYPTYTADSVIRRVLSLNDGTTSNMLNLGGFGSSFDFTVTTGGVQQAGITVASAPNIIQRVSMGYELNNIIVYRNNISQGTDLSATIPACSQINIGNRNGTQQFLGWIRSVALFSTRLSNTQLQALTA